MVKNQKSATAILFGSLVTIMLGFGIILPLMPFYITHFGAGGWALGVMMASFSAMQFLFAPLWGRLSDRVGRKPVLLIGVTGYILSFLINAFANSILVVILSRVLAGMLSSATLPTAMAYMADITEARDRSKGVGLMGAAMGLGMIIGPALGGLLTGLHLPFPAIIQSAMQTMIDPDTGRQINLSMPFLFAAFLALIVLPVIHLALPESLPAGRRVTSAAPSGSRLAQLGAALKSPVGFLYLMALLLSFALANLEGVLGLYGKQEFGLGPAAVGLLMGGMGVVSVIQQGFLIGPLTRRFGEARLLQAGLVVSLAGFTGLALLRYEWAMFVFAFIFISGNVLLQPSVTSLISQRTPPEEQGAAMGVNNSFQSLGRAVGPLWAGVAFDLYPTLSFWTGALFQAIALVYALRTLGAPHPSNPAPAPVLKTTPNGD